MKEFKIDPSRRLTQSISTLVLRSKAIIDSESAKVKRESKIRMNSLKIFL